MDIFIVPMDNLQVEKSLSGYQLIVEEKIYMDYMIENTLTNESLNGHFKDLFGRIDLVRIKEGNYFILSAPSINDLALYNFDINLYLNEKNVILHLVYGKVQIFCFSLWLVKDNAVNISKAYFYDSESGAGLKMTKNIMLSTSKGTYETTPFSKDDFKKSNEWLEILQDYILEKDNSEKEYSRYNNLSSSLSQNTSSFLKAANYIITARNASFLPAKIASYISVLETLFVVTDSNAYKTPQRMAVFLGGPKDERITNFRIVKDAYDIRSRYVHGSDIGNTKYKKIDQISYELDEIVRKVFVKFITSYKNLNYVGNEWKKVDQYFNELVLGGEGNDEGDNRNN